MLGLRLGLNRGILESLAVNHCGFSFVGLKVFSGARKQILGCVAPANMRKICLCRKSQCFGEFTYEITFFFFFGNFRGQAGTETILLDFGGAEGPNTL